MNCVMICSAKYLGIMTLKVLPTSCSRYNSKEDSEKFPILKMKLNRINASVPVQVLFGGFRENDRFLKIFLSFSLENFTHSFNPSQNVSPILLFNNW